LKTPEIWFWQTIISPHMTELASALASKGNSVTYVTEVIMTPDRIQQGWSIPNAPFVEIKIASTVEAVKYLANTAPVNSVHICQGIRGNRLIKIAQRILRKRRVLQWVVMESVEDTGWVGALKRVRYRLLFLISRNWLQGILAIGERTVDWVVERGMSPIKVFPFAYFLSDQYYEDTVMRKPPTAVFRIIFVGQFIERKRLDLLVEALSKLDELQFELVVVGSGPMETEWKLLAESLLPGKIQWIGKLPHRQVQYELSRSDCLVLPSRYDGWGAVVSEALITGTPAICSTECGSAVAVKSSCVGGVFKSGDATALGELLRRSISQGKITPNIRYQIASWAKCLGAKCGAEYLNKIFQFRNNEGRRPVPPWVEKNQTISFK
jgi:glycosyltransferase involved in cell wall biosynthesis